MKAGCMGLLLGWGMMGVAFADSEYITPKIQHGAEKFDDKLLENQYYNQCLMTCSQSEDPNCANNCKSLAKDKTEAVESRR